MPDEFVCTEWQKHNGPNKRSLPVVAPARSRERGSSARGPLQRREEQFGDAVEAGHRALAAARKARARCR